MLTTSNNVSELTLCGARLDHADLSPNPSPLPQNSSSPHFDRSCIPLQSPSSSGELDNYAANFDCNLCMQTCQEPVATLCGHLFCWPCLYIHHHSLSLHSASFKASCPVCKEDVQDRIVPLYGCGSAASMAEKCHGVHIPPRPAAIVHRASRPSKPHHAIEHMMSPQHAGGFSARFAHGTAASLLTRRRRFNNEKEFVLHWLFISVASAASAFFLAC